jgi:hypothetical protein
MASATVARPKATMGREMTVTESDFKNPDDSRVGFHLQQVAATLTLLEDLHADALEIDFSDIGSQAGCTREDMRYSMMTLAIQGAALNLVKAREALHDLFREVELKAKATA